jgi:hypothetical protein
VGLSYPIILRFASRRKAGEARVVDSEADEQIVMEEAEAEGWVLESREEMLRCD